MSTKVVSKIFISWDDIDQLVEELCHKIRISGSKPESVTGIERGGLIPAVMVSHRLGIPYVKRINRNTLVIDDICDTGKTLQEIISCYSATLHYKKTANYVPDFYAKEVGDEWIVYPWENKDSEEIQDYLKR
jgi:hypoxanthine phosphoribosyltransferase